MTKRGHLFVFEGPDGVGKSTLSRLFADRIKAEGVTCERMSFPGGEAGTLGKQVYDLVHGRRPDAGLPGRAPRLLRTDGEGAWASGAASGLEHRRRRVARAA